MQIKLSNIYSFLTKISSGVISVLIVISMFFSIRSQYNELTSSAAYQLNQYNTAISSKLSIMVNSSRIIANQDFIDNISLKNYSHITSSLFLISSMQVYRSNNVHSYINSYILDYENNIYNPKSSAICPFTEFAQVKKYKSNTLIYYNTESSDSFLFIQPLYDSAGKYRNVLITVFDSNFFIEPLLYTDKNTPSLQLHGDDFTKTIISSEHFPFLYIISNTIHLSDSDIQITMRTSILPIIINAFITLVILVLVFFLSHFLARFLAYCVKQSISDPIEKIKVTIDSHAAQPNSDSPQNSETEVI